MPTKRTMVALGASVAAALIASGLVVANASADESGAPAGAVQAESFAAQSGVRTENTGDTGGGKNAALAGLRRLAALRRRDSARVVGHRAGRLGQRRGRSDRAADRFRDRQGARHHRGPADRRLAEVGDGVRDGGVAPGRRADRLRGAEERPGRRLREHQLVHVRRRHRTAAEQPGDHRTHDAPGLRRRLGHHRRGQVERAAGRVQGHRAPSRSRPATSGCRSSTPPARSATACRTTRSSSRAWPAPRTCTASWATRAPAPRRPTTRCSPRLATSCDPAGGPLGLLGADPAGERPAGRPARRDRLLRLAAQGPDRRRCRSRRASG